MGTLHSLGGPARRALMVRAAKTSVLLSLLFVLVYGSTNWFTAQRPSSDVTTWYFAWEPAVIPFVPLLIVPYMSIDLLFFLAPFLCHDDRERQVFARRVVFSILVAAAFFLLMPLRLAWPPRPHVSGWFGTLVEQSCTAPFLMEYPHNLFPALHIILCWILADIYGRQTRGLLRMGLYIWFGLIALSTVLTWQHHVVDIFGGCLVAGFAFYLFRESDIALPVVPNARLGGYYAAGALAILVATPPVWPWGVFLLWPAAALGIVAAAYFGVGPGVFRKTDGRLPPSTYFVMAPVLLGQYLSLAYYRRHCRAWDQVVDNVLIGRILSEAEATEAVRSGVTAVLDLTAEFSETVAFRGVAYRNIPILDLTAPTQNQLREAVDFIAAEAAQGIVYVHCKIGYSRSAAVVGAYLLACNELSPEKVIPTLRSVRPTIIVHPEAIEALEQFARIQCSAELTPLPCAST